MSPRSPAPFRRIRNPRPPWARHRSSNSNDNCLRVPREHKKHSQGDIEKRTGLLRCYISRVECGHTVSAVETLEKYARALEVPMYQLFYDGEEPPKLPHLPKRKTAADIAWCSSGKEARLLVKFCRLFKRVQDSDRVLMLFMAQKMARRRAA